MLEDMNREVVVREEHLQYASLLLSALARVSQHMISEKDAGISALLALFAVLPASIRNSFEEQIQGLVETIQSDQYVEKGVRVMNMSARGRYEVTVYEILAGVTDALDEAGLLWKTKTELRGSEE